MIVELPHLDCVDLGRLGALVMLGLELLALD